MESLENISLMVLNVNFLLLILLFGENKFRDYFYGNHDYNVYHSTTTKATDNGYYYMGKRFEDIPTDEYWVKFCKLKAFIKL